MPSARLFILVFLIAATAAISCSTYSGKSFLPGIAGYNEKDRQVFVLKKKLLEISGIIHLGGETMAAINDEKGELFIINMENDSMGIYKFRGKDDYEDLAKTDSMYYVLESDGDLHELTPPPEVNVTTYHYNNEGKTEFESLVWYKKEHKLVMISKDQRDKKAGINAYSFNLDTKQFDPGLFFNIPIENILRQLQNFSAECKPSGAAIHPITHKLFIVASVGKLLLQCSTDGKLEKINKLNPSQFPQPEGISFADNGDMYISNEGLDGKATILKFPYSGKK